MYLFAVECKFIFFNFQIALFWFVCLAAYYCDDEIKETKMDGACDTYGTELRVDFRYDPTRRTKEQNGG